MPTEATIIDPRNIVTPEPPTPEQIAEKKKADEKGMAFFTGVARGAKPEAKPAETEEEKIAREKKEADEAAAKAGENKGEKKEDKAAPAKAAVAPAKKVIRRAKGFENVEDESVNKLTVAADKLSAAADKVEKAATTTATPPKKEEPVTTKFSPEEQRELTVLSTLKEVFPDKAEYKDIEKRAEKYLTALPGFEEKFEKDFAAKWERQNGEKTFDSEDTRDAAFNDARSAAFEKESSKFKATFNIEPDPDDFDEAKIALRTRPLEKKLNETQQQLSQREAREHTQMVQQFAAEKGQSAVVDLSEQIVATLGDGVKAMFKADGSVDTDKLADIEDGDIIAEAVQEVSERSKNFAEDVILFLATPDNARKGETYVNNPVYRFAKMQEDRLASLPPEKTKDADGKTFARGSDFAKMSEAERATHWVLDGDTLISLANDTVFIPLAKEQIEAEKKRTQQRIERRGLKLGEKAAPAKQAAATTGTETQNAKPNSPAATDPAAPPSGAKPGAAGVLSKLATGRWS